MTKFIEAIGDKSGKPEGLKYFINTKYIVQMRLATKDELFNPLGADYPKHFIAKIACSGGIVETVHISLEDGQALREKKDE